MNSDDATFSIQGAAERSGLSAHVIRAWERRYHAIQPSRSAGRQRMYSDLEIARLSLLRRAVENGHGIGKIANFSSDDLRKLVADDQSPRGSDGRSAGPRVSSQELRKRAISAIARYDGEALEATLRNALVSQGQRGLLKKIVAPLAEETGELWRSGAFTAAQEHFFTASVKVFLGQLTRQYVAPANAPGIVIGTPLGQLHELGALMAAAVAASLGWRTIYLGPSLPAHEIAGAVAKNGATAVALSIVYPNDDPGLEWEIEELARLLPAGTRIVAGGRSAQAYEDTLKGVGAFCVKGIAELDEVLEAIRRR